jgi:hypothetical protein
MAMIESDDVRMSMRGSNMDYRVICRVLGTDKKESISSVHLVALGSTHLAELDSFTSQT